TRAGRYRQTKSASPWGLTPASSSRRQRSSYSSPRGTSSDCQRVMGLAASHVGEAGVVREERQADGARGSAPVLGDDDLRRADVRAVGVVDLVAVDEQDDVG